MAPIRLKSPSDIAKMREAGRLVAQVLQLMQEMAAPGVRTEQLDAAAADFITEHGAAPAFKGYRGYPANICTSINEEVVHGIPGPRKLADGDLLKVDVGVLWDGFYGDAASTLKDVIDAIAAGAQGVVVGRKVWQRPEDETKWLISEMAKATRSAFSRRW